MTFRSVIIGILGALFLGSFNYVNGAVCHSTGLVSNHFPVIVYGTLLVFLLIFNPVLAKLGSKWAFSAKELVVVMAMMLFACFPPDRGLLGSFTHEIMWPQHYVKTELGWQGEPYAFNYASISNWAGITRTLKQSQSATPGNPVKAIWDHLPMDLQQDVRNIPEGSMPAPDTRNKLLDCLNGLLSNKDLPAEMSALNLSPDARRALQEKPDVVSPDPTQKINRNLIASLFPGSIKPRREGVIESIPPRMLPDLTGNESKALDGFVTGATAGNSVISLTDIPWGAWARPMLFWLPLVLFAMLAVTGLSMMIHHQWSNNEHLPYPVVNFAQSLLPLDGQTSGAIFRDPLFLIAMFGICAIHLFNFANAWFPQKFVPIKLVFDFSALLPYFPTISRGGPWIYIFSALTIYFSVIGFSYFIPKDVSFSLGISPFVFITLVGFCKGYGISFGNAGEFLSPNIQNFMTAGAYFGLFIVLAWTGRHFYLNALKQGCFLASSEKIPGYAVTGSRLFLLGYVAMVVILICTGLNWILAIVYSAGAFIIWTVTSRLFAEGGVFYMHPNFTTCAIIWGLFGARAIGPDPLLIMGMVSVVLLGDPSGGLMPYVVTANKLIEHVGEKIGRVTAWGFAALILCLAVALPTTIYVQYWMGARVVGAGWGAETAPKYAPNANAQVRQTLDIQGVLAEAKSPDRPAFLNRITLTPPLLIAFGATCALVLLLGACRLRWTWWPIHPFLLVIMSTFHAIPFAFSLLIGCAIKTIVSRYGGPFLYNRLKPLMLGLVAGDMLLIAIQVVVNLTYYMIVGENPPSFVIRP